MIKIKLCGVCSIADAHGAIDAGADMLGFVCAPMSHRCVSFEQLEQIVAQLREQHMSLPRIVAVVAGTPYDDITQLAASSIVDAIQISDVDDAHALDALAAVRSGDAQIEVIRAVHVAADIDHAERAHRWSTELGAAILYDAFGASRAAGGSGTRLDLDLLDRATVRKRCGIAGGLTPTTVASVVTALQPAFVDVSSGIESAPGHKSIHLMREFVQAARAAAIPIDQPQELLR